MSEELKGCPFCGKAPIVGNESCRCGTLCCPLCDKHVRLAIWQTRPVEDGLRAEIEKLESDDESKWAKHYMAENDALKGEIDGLRRGIKTIESLTEIVSRKNDALKAALRELLEE